MNYLWWATSYFDELFHIVTNHFISTANQLWLLSIRNENVFFQTLILKVKQIVKHHLLLKWNKYTAVAGDEHIYLNRKKFYVIICLKFSEN